MQTKLSNVGRFGVEHVIGDLVTVTSPTAGPLRKEAGARARTLSKITQAALTSDASRAASAFASGLTSPAATFSGAPKSVVAPPRRCSRTRATSLPALN